jgi:hypothetical protein
MRKNICALALVVASIGIGAPAAYADSPGCVTKPEYRRVHDGMRQGRVHRIFDTRGRRDTVHSGGGVVIEVRSYRTCRRDSAVSVSYRNRRVTAKFAIWRRG